MARGGHGIDVYDRISERVDLARFRPKVAADVELKRFPLRWGNDYAMIANPRAMIYFRLEPWEADMVPLMDGTRTVGEIIVERLEDDGELDTAGASELVQLLEVGGFLEPVPVGLDDGLTRALDPLTPAQRKIRGFMKTLSIEWSGADRFVRWWYRTLLWPFYRPAGVVLASILAVGGLVAFFAVERSGDFSLGTRSAPVESLILLGLDFVLTFFHELGHAATIVHYGRRVKSAGFMIYFGSPAFFVESSDSLMLDRRQRIAQSFAGPFSEFVLAGVASLALVAFRDSNLAELLFKFALINYFVIFLNLIPLLELDGYWILSDLIQVPDLRQRSLQFIQHDLWHKLRTRERLSKQEVGLGLYAVVGVAFTILCFYSAYYFWKRIFGGLITSLWNGGLGSRLLLVLLVVFFAGPALRGLLQLARAAYRRIRGLVRRVDLPRRIQMARRGGRAHRRAPRVRRSSRRRAERPRRSRPTAADARRTAGVPPGRSTRRVLHRPRRAIRDRGGGSGDPGCAGAQHPRTRGSVRGDGPLGGGTTSGDGPIGG